MIFLVTKSCYIVYHRGYLQIKKNELAKKINKNILLSRKWSNLRDVGRWLKNVPCINYLTTSDGHWLTFSLIRSKRQKTENRKHYFSEIFLVPKSSTNAWLLHQCMTCAQMLHKFCTNDLCTNVSLIYKCMIRAHISIFCVGKWPKKFHQSCKTCQERGGG